MTKILLFLKLGEGLQERETGTGHTHNTRCSCDDIGETLEGQRTPPPTPAARLSVTGRGPFAAQAAAGNGTVIKEEVRFNFPSLKKKTLDIRILGYVRYQFHLRGCLHSVGVTRLILVLLHYAFVGMMRHRNQPYGLKDWPIRPVGCSRVDFGQCILGGPLPRMLWSLSWQRPNSYLASTR